MLRAVLFDFDGVLVDSEPIHFTVLNEVFAREGFDLTETMYNEEFLCFDDAGCIDLAFKKMNKPLDPDRRKQLLEAKAAGVEKAIREGRATWFPGAKELLREASERGTAAIVSAARRSEIESVLDQAGCRGAVSVIVASGDTEKSKPSPQPYLRALELLRKYGAGFSSREAAAIEDSPGGCRAARAAGVPVAAVAHTVDASELAGLADMVAPSINALNWSALESLVRA